MIVNKMTHIFFKNSLTLIDSGFKGPFKIEELAEESSLHSVSLEWINKNGSPLIKEITQIAYAHLMKESNLMLLFPPYNKQLHLVVDVRIQRLMPGMYPSIPGWHCDAVPRNDYFAQPDLTKLDTKIKHLTLTLSTEKDGVSNTEFVNEGIPFEYKPEDRSMSVWQQVHRRVFYEANLNTVLPLRTIKVPDNKLAIFSQDTIHRASPCHKRGWRMFYRMAMMDKPALNTGLVREQQVYILSEENGW